MVRWLVCRKNKKKKKKSEKQTECGPGEKTRWKGRLKKCFKGRGRNLDFLPEEDLAQQHLGREDSSGGSRLIKRNQGANSFRKRKKKGLDTDKCLS